MFQKIRQGHFVKLSGTSNEMGQKLNCQWDWPKLAFVLLSFVVYLMASRVVVFSKSWRGCCIVLFCVLHSNEPVLRWTTLDPGRVSFAFKWIYCLQTAWRAVTTWSNCFLWEEIGSWDLILLAPYTPTSKFHWWLLSVLFHWLDNERLMWCLSDVRQGHYG